MKKNNLDSPDGGPYYWGDKETFIVKNNQNFGWSSLMIYLNISYNMSIILNKIKGRMYSEKYIELLEKRVLPIIILQRSRSLFICQQVTHVFIFPKIAEDFLRNNI